MAPPERVARNVLLDSLTIDPQRRRFIADHDGTSGTLYQQVRVDTPQKLAERAVELSYDGLQALIEFDGSVGDLVVLDQAGTVTALARRVPPGYVQTNWVLSEFDGTAGRLLRVAAPNSSAPTVSTLAERVPTHGYDSFAITDVGYGFASLSDWDAGASAGHLRVTWNGESVDFGPGVAEFNPVFYPKPGILYARREGKDAGIWYAMVRQ